MRQLLSVLCALFLTTNVSFALDAALQSKIDAKIGEIKSWGSDPVIVNAVKAYNSAPSAQAKEMNQDKWKASSLLDPFIKELSRNDAAKLLKAKGGAVSEAFVSGSDGTKVAFITKTSSWSHKGKPKHDKPMSGTTWQGDVEVDESTGVKQIQVAVPVMDGGSAIGSLVIGLDISKL